MIQLTSSNLSNREDQLHKVMNQLESFLLQWLKTSLRDLQDSILKVSSILSYFVQVYYSVVRGYNNCHEFWLQLLFGHLCNYAKEGLKTFTDKFGDVPMVRQQSPSPCSGADEVWCWLKQWVTLHSIQAYILGRCGSLSVCFSVYYKRLQLVTLSTYPYSIPHV